MSLLFYCLSLLSSFRSTCLLFTLFRLFFFFFNDTATTEIYTLSLHDALPIWTPPPRGWPAPTCPAPRVPTQRSEEHTSELQSLRHLVCRLLLEKKKKKKQNIMKKNYPDRTTNTKTYSHHSTNARSTQVMAPVR